MGRVLAQEFESHHKSPARKRNQKESFTVSVDAPKLASILTEENKKELFVFLSQEAVKIETDGKKVIATNGKDVWCYPATYTSKKMSPCSHEEADTRMMVHLADAVDRGHNSIMIRTVDTDVVVLAVAAVQTLGIKKL